MCLSLADIVLLQINARNSIRIANLPLRMCQLEHYPSLARFRFLITTKNISMEPKNTKPPTKYPSRQHYSVNIEILIDFKCMKIS